MARAPESARKDSEVLQPSLLDRLTDDLPQETQEGLDARTFTRNRLRAAVLRDLSWLLNSTTLAPGGEGALEEREAWQRAPCVHESVLNFGLPAMSGKFLSELQTRDVGEAVALAIRRFEPRIDPKSLEVRVVSNDYAESAHNRIGLEIRGQLWSEPVPLALVWRSELDVETGHASVREA